MPRRPGEEEQKDRVREQYERRAYSAKTLTRPNYLGEIASCQGLICLFSLQSAD